MPETSSPPVPWARVHLVRGAAPQQLSFRAGEPRRVRVGSAPDSDFRVPLTSVAPSQLELAWDGEQLWLADPLRLGVTFVNGRPLNEWVNVQGEAIVSFGPVRLWLATARLGVRRATPDFSAIERAHGAPLPALGSAAARRCQTGRITLTPEYLQIVNAAGET